MNKRLIFCVETTRQANTDYPYILETIRHFYIDNKKSVFRPVFMRSKTRYNSRGVQDDIQRECAYSKNNHIFYCIDTDDWNTSAEDELMLKKIQSFCQSRNYELIFFCRDIEEVYCGRQLPDTEKAAAIARFRRSRGIVKMKSDMLEKEQPLIHCSNILTILDQYLERK